MSLVEVGEFLTNCRYCGTREMCHHQLNGRDICGNCIKREMGPPPKQEAVEEPVAEETQPVDELPRSHAVINGKVYDISPRPIQCDHKASRNLEKLTGRLFNYCAECGSYLRRREKPLKKLDKKGRSK